MVCVSWCIKTGFRCVQLWKVIALNFKAWKVMQQFCYPQDYVTTVKWFADVCFNVKQFSHLHMVLGVC